VTAAEITLLRSLAETDVVAFMPESSAAAAVARFDAALGEPPLSHLPTAG
jgi:hypothetical protein